MKSVTTFIVIGCILLISALSFGVYVWYTIQTYQKELRNPSATPVEDRSIANHKNVVE